LFVLSFAATSIYTASLLRLNLNSASVSDVIAPSTIQLVPLDALHAGEGGVVADLDGPVGPVNRLQELGLRVGQRVRMLRPGPPHLVQLGETRLCLRPESDVTVLVGLGEG
jgi:Fe2+ transport system protein FeoA